MELTIEYDMFFRILISWQLLMLAAFTFLSSINSKYADKVFTYGWCVVFLFIIYGVWFVNW